MSISKEIRVGPDGNTRTRRKVNFQAITKIFTLHNATFTRDANGRLIETLLYQDTDYAKRITFTRDGNGKITSMSSEEVY